MSRKDSVQKRLQEIRPPRVQLTYEVQVGGSTERKELPFVVGVLGDFTGACGPDEVPVRLKDRKFVNVDLETFDDVMAGMGPRASFRVSNVLTPEGGEFAVNLSFSSMQHFRPESVVQQVEPLRRLLEARARLCDLRNKLAGNHKLDDLLTEALSSSEQLQRLGYEAGGPGEQGHD